MRHFLIPARGGSKGIIDKNLTDLGGHPLVRWSVECAKEAAAGLPVAVSSDDDKILDVAEACGAQPYKRPAHLGDDQATMRDVVRDFFKATPTASEVVLLYPTVPFRLASTVRAALACYDAGTMAGPYRTLMSVRESRGRPFGGVQIINGKMVYGEEASAYYQRQHTPALYFANGAIYVIHRDVVDALNTQLFNAETVPFVMYGAENLDIDAPWDLEMARAMVAGGLVRVPRAWAPLTPAQDGVLP